jgi:ABC-type amino acid transport substrate-binding protein
MPEKSIKACVACIVGLLLLVPHAQARPFDDVIDSGYITIFVYKDYAPYSWETEDGELKGIDVEVAQKFAEDLGVELRMLVRGADENIDDDLRINIWKGDLIHRRVADVMMHAPYDREVDTRNELAVLMGPYFLEHMALVVNREKLPVVENFARFMNQPIAVELDTAGDFFLSNAFRGALQQSIRRGRTFADVVDQYSNGEVAAAMGSLAQAEWIASQAAAVDSYIAKPPMPGIVRRNWPVGFAVKHDSRDLGYALADVATQLMTSGELAKITEKYGVTYYAPE